MSQGPSALYADAAWRLEAPPPRRWRARKIIAILVALAIELGVFGLVWSGRGLQPAPQAEEIPVEIVVEKPPPPPPPPAEEQQQQQQQELEKPATDAPREGKSDHDDDNVAEKETPAKAPPPPAPPTPSPEASQAPPPPAPPIPSPEASQAPPAPAPELPQTAEAEAPPPKEAEPIETPAPPPPPQKAEPTQTPAPSKPSIADVLPKTYNSVPDIDFGGAAIRSPVTGGNAKSSYLTQLYGLIVPRLRVPAVAHTYGRRLTGAIGFSVDGRGRLTQRFVVIQSGSMELDEAAMRAVAAASHSFPAPPHGAPVGMKFTYSVD